MEREGDGKLYGATKFGGQFDRGTIFSFSPTEGVEDIYSFGAQSDDGDFAWCSLTVGPDDRLYGTTSGGGMHDAGTIFAITPGTGNYSKPRFSA